MKLSKRHFAQLGFISDAAFLSLFEFLVFPTRVVSLWKLVTLFFHKPTPNFTFCPFDMLHDATYWISIRSTCVAVIPTRSPRCSWLSLLFMGLGVIIILCWKCMAVTSPSILIDPTLDAPFPDYFLPMWLLRRSFSSSEQIMISPQQYSIRNPTYSI